MSDSVNNSTAAAEIDEQLVAYLDGELDDSQRGEVESRLAEDESVRLRLKELDYTWELLNELPVSEVNEEEFARSTVEMITVAASQEVETYQEDTQKKNKHRWLLAISLGVISLAMGYFIVNRAASQRDRELLTDLPVIEAIDKYQRVESIEFLELLDQEGLFAEEVESES